MDTYPGRTSHGAQDLSGTAIFSDQGRNERSPMKNPESKEVIPLYSRVASSLRNKILSGQYEPGIRLPGEEALAEYYGVSRITIREALAHLEREGLINRYRGKGTFISEKIPNKQRSVYTSLSDIVNQTQQSIIKSVGIWTIKVSQASIANDIKSFFGLSNGDPIAKIHRVVMRNGSPLHLFENFMLPGLAAHITREDIIHKKAILRILQEKIDLKIGRGEMFIEAMPADPEIAGILKCQVFDPFIRLQTHIYFPNDDPLEIVNYFMQAEYFRFKTDIDTEDFNPAAWKQ